MRRHPRRTTLMALLCGSFLFGGTFTCRSGDDDDDDDNDNRAGTTIVVAQAGAAVGK